jgi:hypothetical protein
MNMGAKTRFMPTSDRPEVPFAEPVAHEAAGDLREPVIDAREEGEDGARSHNVVEVADDVIRVMQGEVDESEEPSGRPVRPTDAEHGQEAEANSICVLKRIEPPQS